MQAFKIPLLATVSVLAGCAVMDERGTERVATPVRTGEEVSSICFERNINNFKAIEGVDDAILLEANVDDWYKATLIGACSYDRLKFMEGVAIESNPAGGCVTSGDYLVFTRSAFGDTSFPNTTRCAISEIHEWDEDPADPEE